MRRRFSSTRTSKRNHSKAHIVSQQPPSRHAPDSAPAAPFFRLCAALRLAIVLTAGFKLRANHCIQQGHMIYFQISTSGQPIDAQRARNMLSALREQRVRARKVTLWSRNQLGLVAMSVVTHLVLSWCVYDVRLLRCDGLKEA